MIPYEWGNRTASVSQAQICFFPIDRNGGSMSALDPLRMCGGLALRGSMWPGADRRFGEANLKRTFVREPAASGKTHTWTLRCGSMLPKSGRSFTRGERSNLPEAEWWLFGARSAKADVGGVSFSRATHIFGTVAPVRSNLRIGELGCRPLRRAPDAAERWRTRSGSGRSGAWLRSRRLTTARGRELYGAIISSAAVGGTAQLPPTFATSPEGDIF